MRPNPAQQRTGRSSGKGASAYRTASRRPRPARVARRRTAIPAGRRRRRPLLFYAVTAAVVGQLAAIVVDMEALVLLFSLTELFLAAVVFQAVKA